MKCDLKHKTGNMIILNECNHIITDLVTFVAYFSVLNGNTDGQVKKPFVPNVFAAILEF